jgi:hypothetical protein
MPKKPKLHKNELNTTFFCSTSSPKGSKSLKIYKISLTFCFDKLSNLSKSVHTGENSQILTVSNKKVVLRDDVSLINLKKKIKRAMEKNDNVKGINVI